MKPPSAEERERSQGWIDMAFFCLHRLKMSPEQVAEMLAPDDAAFRATMTFYLRDHYTYALTEKALRDRRGRHRIS